MDFYDRVKELVRIKKLSLIPFLQNLGINYETYKSAKRLGNFPSADKAFHIAKALETTVEYLMTGQESDVMQELIELKKKILSFAQSVQ